MLCTVEGRTVVEFSFAMALPHLLLPEGAVLSEMV
jgi:hypothetical protein